MKKVTKHVLIPAILAVLFFAIAMLPIEFIGCRNRGLIAAFVAIAAGLLGIIAALRALMGKGRGDTNSSLWMASALIFAIPIIVIAVGVI